MNRSSRRDFLSAGIGAALTATPLFAAKPRATDWVKLGNSGVKVTRLAFGTGTKGGSVQRALGQQQFTRLVRHAYDQGIRFFETADAYAGMPAMLATALNGIPRDSYKLMTKFRLRDAQGDIRATMDRLRRDLNTEYLDILLMHCVRSPKWPEELAKLQDEFSEAQHKKIIIAKGASVHGLLPLRRFPGHKWLDVALFRVNHKGAKMDTLQPRDTEDLGDVNEVFTHVTAVHQQGTGVLGMKLIGEGQFATIEDRQAAMRKVFHSGAIDAVTIGYSAPAEIDEDIETMNRILQEKMKQEK